MSERMKEVESRGQDVEAAIAAGLEILQVDRDDVSVEIVDEGARGLLGIGGRDAVVRLAVVKPRAETVTKPEIPEETERREEGQIADIEDDEEIDVESVAIQTVQELMDRLQVSAEVTAHLSEPDDLTGHQVYVLDVEGDDLGMLIGSRGETLNAIQHVTRLMVGHKIRRRANIVVDVQGYRKRREKALGRLAERMAKKVASRNRAIALEAMPPHERRIIHMTLRDHEDVYTQSTGEGNRRRVRIFPKEND